MAKDKITKQSKELINKYLKEIYDYFRFHGYKPNRVSDNTFYKLAKLVGLNEATKLVENYK